MAVLYNAMQIEKGARIQRLRHGAVTQPIQFLSRAEKDEAWAAWNMDWLEQVGLKQIRAKSKRYMRNYRMAAGIIDKSDYIPEENPMDQDIIETLYQNESQAATELKFFPITPSLVNLMVGEFSERTDRISYTCKDRKSYNEMLAAKQEMVEQSLLGWAEQDMMRTLQKQGMDPGSEEAQQALAPENLKTMPQIEQYFQRDYKSVYEEWATHLHYSDTDRFRIHEQEQLAFRDFLCNDTEVWHLRMGEDDYELENWNPALTFATTSLGEKYISNGSLAGNFQMLTLSDVIDTYGYLMDADQVRSLERIYPATNAKMIIPGITNDGSYYDHNQTYAQNTSMPSAAMRQFMAFNDTFSYPGQDVIGDILSVDRSQDELNNEQYYRVTTGYWASQRMFYHLTEVKDDSMPAQSIVDESFKVTCRPLYDTTIIKKKCKENLIYGQHIEPVWAKQVWGGVKIGPNRTGWSSSNSGSQGDGSVYLNVKPIKYQFKGEYSIYGAKLPVEGVLNTARNTISKSFVERTAPFQIGYNIMNNQIMDITMDELGTIILLDQNTLPQNSLGEDWGKGNYAKAYMSMKDFSILPLDTSLANTESPINFNHFQTLNLEQTNRLLGKVQLANYFKEAAFEAVGITQQRRGAIGSQETAEGIKQAMNTSFAQTEPYFTTHSEHIMPRVHQMRTDLAMFYSCTNPSVRLSYNNSLGERINFEINGLELTGREIGASVTTRVNVRRILEQMRNLAIQNNTSNASIFDLGSIISSQSMSEMDTVLKSIEQKSQKLIADQQAHEQEMQDKAIAAQQQAEAEQRAYDAEEAILDRSRDVTVAEIRAAGNQMGDINANEQSDYLDALDRIEGKRLQNEQLNLKREDSIHKRTQDDRKLGLQQAEMQSRERIADKALQVARTNKNQYDRKSSKK